MISAPLLPLESLYLYEDEHIFALKKPAGIHSVGLPSGQGGASLADLLLEDTPSLGDVAPNKHDAGLVQRLDFDTSGIILGAKTKSALESLHQALLRGAFTKRYIALVEGVLEESITISSYIGSQYRGAKKMRSYKNPPSDNSRALQGISTYKPHATCPIAGMSFVEVSASPARRHQVRIHAATIGHALVGDTLYGSGLALPDITVSPRAFFLHAHYLKGTHPLSKKDIEIRDTYDQEISYKHT